MGSPGAPSRAAGRTPFLTERGYLLLVKTFRDQLAWQVQEQLVEGYFRDREGTATPTERRPR